MEEYRAYAMGSNGHVINRIDIRCSDEEEARRLAKIAVGGDAVELWQMDRFIERFEPALRPALPARAFRFKCLLALET
jgi:hypothetical protein